VLVRGAQQIAIVIATQSEERPMELRPRDTTKFARVHPVVACAQCGERLFVPELSEFVDARRIRHLWECEACGYAFETTVRFAAA
jgi:transcription elongation factor Elf1